MSDLKDLIKAAQRAGWTVVKRRNGHYKLTAPSGEFIFTASTPSDWRATLNLAAHLRRLGLEIE
jgi:hypothetical protein